ncbi:protealysin inhibitor emfourin [Actinoplanes flavus]|uniref:Uncharacterized protein n=1 Tax=Actinoplanes flavus TaxID=2820290 RepID=A0ABS3UL40_9ACTN|nr:protealysin inhibitor emfourin [Actinoplanes flavus]MBO3739513.1 hypothetical protein [Actinoplanes flavus]
MNFSNIRFFRHGIAAVLMLATLLSIAVTTRPASAAAAEPRTELVLVQRSGGLAGVVEHFTVDRTTTGRNAADVLTMTASRPFRALRSAYLPADPCCDRFTYTVVVTYSDHTAKTVTTVENTPGTPRILLDVIESALLTAADRASR